MSNRRTKRVPKTQGIYALGIPDPRVYQLNLHTLQWRVILSADGQEYLALLRFERNFLERIFGQKWFQKPRPGHPAYLLWQLLGSYLGKEGIIDLPANLDEMTALGRASLDAFLLVALAGGNLLTRDSGDLKTYGGEDMQRFLTTRLPVKELFEDVICELAFAGWHQSEGNTVTPDQRDGMPDLHIDLPPMILADCKRPTTTNTNSLKNHLKKTNKQVTTYNERHGTEYPGIAVVDISDAIQIGRVITDEVPAPVTALEEEVHRLLHGPYSSLSAVLLLWDDLVIEELDPKTWYRFRRRYRQINHQAPKRPVPEGRLFEQIEVRHSVLKLKPLPRPIIIQSTPDFDQLVSRLHVDPRLAAVTYLEPDNVQTFFFNNTMHRRFTLRLKQFPHTTPAFVLLIGADENPGTDDKPSEVVLQFALPLRADDLPTIPRQFLIELVQQYGVPFSFQGQQVRMLNGVDMNGTPAAIGEELHKALSGDHTWLYVGLSADEAQPEEPVRIGLAFRLELEKYAHWAAPRTPPEG